MGLSNYLSIQRKSVENVSERLQSGIQFPNLHETFKSQRSYLLLSYVQLVVTSTYI